MTAAPPSAVFSEDVLELLASGVDVYVATRDDALRPESMFCMGFAVHPERGSVTVYLPEALSGPTLTNLRQNGCIAATFSRACDHRTVQLKGKVANIRASDERDRELQLEYRAALAEQFAFVGVPRATTRRLVWWPSVAVDFAVTDVFAQTPGPRAGERLAGDAP